MGDAFNPWMITFLFEVNPVLFDQKQFSNFAQQKDMNEMTIHEFKSVLRCKTEFSCISNFLKCTIMPNLYHQIDSASHD